MATKFRVIIIALYLFAATACTTTQPAEQPVVVKSPTQAVRYVTVKQIEASLPPTRVVAGFDIDDTVLFSSPGFYYGLENHDGPGGANRYGQTPLDSKAFWNDMNGRFDKFSLPKKSGAKLLEMHKKRGDTIVFITARDSSQVNIVPKILAQTFKLQHPVVIFTCSQTKDSSIVAKKVTIYYGDSDTDIDAAQRVNVRPIRVLRSRLSTNPTSYEQVGKKGEEVLIDSEN